MYLYIQSEPSLWTVGFYDPSGKWQSESDHDTKEQAAERVHWLNGSNTKEPFDYEKAATCYNKDWDHSDFHTTYPSLQVR